MKIPNSFLFLFFVYSTACKKVLKNKIKKTKRGDEFKNLFVEGVIHFIQNKKRNLNNSSSTGSTISNSNNSSRDSSIIVYNKS